MPPSAIDVCEQYSGSLIQDLHATVERAEQAAERRSEKGGSDEAANDSLRQG